LVKFFEYFHKHLIVSRSFFYSADLNYLML